MARRLLHRALLLDPVGPSIEQKFDRQAAPRLHARLVEAMDDAHHVAAAIGTDPGRFQPKISVEPTLGAPEILLDTFHGTVRRADDGVVDQAGRAEARCLAPAVFDDSCPNGTETSRPAAEMRARLNADANQRDLEFMKGLQRQVPR